MNILIGNDDENYYQINKIRDFEQQRKVESIDS